MIVRSNEGMLTLYRILRVMFAGVLIVGFIQMLWNGHWPMIVVFIGLGALVYFSIIAVLLTLREVLRMVNQENRG